MGTLRRGNGNTAGGVPFVVNAAFSCAKERHARESQTARCIDSTGSFATNQGGTLSVDPSTLVVRRLTPRECERLMGLPDDYTLVPGLRPNRLKKQQLDEVVAYLEESYGRPFSEQEVRGLAADGPRYRAIGNSIAVPCLGWLGRRLELVHRRAHA